MRELRASVFGMARLLCGSAAIATSPLSAQAQSAAAGQPIVGNLPGAKPSQTGNRERVSIQPSVTLSYDSNILRRDPAVVGGKADNRRLTPSISLGYNRQIGRTQVRLAAAIGYDFNSRFKYLDRERLSLSGGVVLPVGAQCPVSLSLSQEQSQYDLADTEDVRASVQTIREINGSIACTRPGITPNLGASYRTIRNSESEAANSNYAEAHAGMRFSLPSVGALTLNGQLAKITRPDFERITGLQDDTQITRVYLAVSRGVAARFKFSGSIGLVDASPTRETVPDFTALSYSAEVRYVFTPRIQLSFAGSRDVTNSTGVSATYVVRDELRTTLDVDVFNRTTLSLVGSNVTRGYKRDQLLEGPRIGSDEMSRASIRLSREIGRRLRLGLSGSYVTRDADVDIFDFDSTSVALSISSRF